MATGTQKKNKEKYDREEQTYKPEELDNDITTLPRFNNKNTASSANTGWQERIKNGLATDEDMNTALTEWEAGRYNPGPKTEEALIQLKNGGIGSGSSPSGSVEATSSTGGWAGGTSLVEKALSKAQQNSNTMMDKANSETSLYGQKYGFNPVTGKSEHYTSLSDLKEEANDKTEAYNKAVANNPSVVESQRKQKEIKDAKSADFKADIMRGGIKAQGAVKLSLKIEDNKRKQQEIQSTLNELVDSGEDNESIQMKLAEVNGVLFDIDVENQSLQESMDAIEGIDNGEIAEKLAYNAQQKAKYEVEAAQLVEKLNNVDSANEQLQSLSDEIANLQSAKAALLSDDFDTYFNYLQTSGTPAEIKMMQKYGQLVDVIKKVDEDGNITLDEAKQLGVLLNQYEAEEKDLKNADPNIVNAQNEMRNAKNRYGFYLMDEIKSWIVFAVGVGTGNPQMIYSALGRFNKEISEAESGYISNNIKSFGKNAQNEINGTSDASYSLKQTIADLLGQDALQTINAASEGKGVDALYEAFKFYKANIGKDVDFGAWVTAQKNQSAGGWLGTISALLGAGVLNKDSLTELYNKYISGNGTEDTTSDGETKEDVVSFHKTGDWLNNAWDNASSQNVVAQADPKVMKDKQGTVNNAIQSRMTGQGAAPQGQSMQVNQGFGRTNV